MSDAPFTLKVEGMHCGNCVRRVTQTLEAIDGVELDEVVVGRATGSFDPTATDAQAIADAVTRAGYPAAATDAPDGAGS